jgi:hypothetical protein
LTALVAAGPNMLLSTAPRTCGSSWLCTEFRQGELVGLGHWRLGIGWSF